MHTLEIFFRERGEAKGFFHCCVFIFVWFSFRFFFFAFVYLVAYFDLFPYEGHGRSEGRTKGTGR